MIIKTSDTKLVKSFLSKLTLPKQDSHKGQNGRVLIIGGSSLFHSASLWAAEVASHFCDMVHYSSTKENQEIFLSLKKKFQNGIIVPKEQLMEYVKEDDAILVGPGMLRKDQKSNIKDQNDILKIKNEADYTRELVFYLIKNFPKKQFILDAGALQMMEANWLLKLKTPAIITPHQKEFETLFGESIFNLPLEKKIKLVRLLAKKYNTIILLKAIVDIISDGKEIYLIKGGNAGLTKGGTGDILAGLTTALSISGLPLISAISASVLLKKAGEKLFQSKGYWYNVSDIVEIIPEVLKKYINI